MSLPSEVRARSGQRDLDNPQEKTSNKLSRRQLIVSVGKKLKCDERAQTAVITLLERYNKAADFLAQLPHIHQSHYDDVVDERHILRYCGYPLCNELLENIPAQRYKISTVINKVYDLVERKKYCSALCYKASLYIRSQLLISPLWLRSHQDLPDFQLLMEPPGGL